MTPLGNQNVDLVFGSWGAQSGFQTGIGHCHNLTQDNTFYITNYQPELPTTTSSCSMLYVFYLVNSLGVIKGACLPL
jgi:hypothetical protein